MDMCLTMIFIWLIFALLILILVLIERRPKPYFVIQNRDIYSFKREAINKLSNQGYIVKEKHNDRLFVQKDSFTATTLVFRQNESNVDVLYVHSNSTAIFISIIVLFITIWIIGLVLAIIVDTKSKDFRDGELKSILTGYNMNRRVCPNCGRGIPFDANICPYCGLRF